MEAFRIKGGRPLNGEVTVSGSKNATLPLMAAALLTRERCVIRRVPNLSDVRFMGEILRSLGARVTFEGETVTIEAASIREVGKYDLIRKMRASRHPRALDRWLGWRVSPGGCTGARPIDLHREGAARSAPGSDCRHVIGEAARLTEASPRRLGRPHGLGTATG
jgi:UDP-N-acetylglucosamine 1-carboxyvinyltransferase